jgi:hypothetical protein
MVFFMDAEYDKRRMTMAVEIENKSREEIEEMIEWEVCTSEKGKKFRVGFLKGSDTHAGEQADSGKQDFGISVVWPVLSNHWNYQPSSVSNISAITRYALYRNSGDIYEYRIEFTNTEHYDYHFYDETGDSYRCNTFRNGDHFIDYDSDKPAILYIRGD